MEVFVLQFSSLSGYAPTVVAVHTSYDGAAAKMAEYTAAQQACMVITNHPLVEDVDDTPNQ